MTTRPDFDFQLGRTIRLRGWGRSGIAALILLLATAIAISPSAALLQVGLSRLIFAQEK